MQNTTLITPERLAVETLTKLKAPCIIHGSARDAYRDAEAHFGGQWIYVVPAARLMELFHADAPQLLRAITQLAGGVADVETTFFNNIAARRAVSATDVAQHAARIVRIVLDDRNRTNENYDENFLALLDAIWNELFELTTGPAPDTDVVLRMISPAVFARGKTAGEIMRAAAQIRQLRLAGYARTDSYEESTRLEETARRLDEIAQSLCAREEMYLSRSINGRLSRHSYEKGQAVWSLDETGQKLNNLNLVIQDVSRGDHFGYSYILCVGETNFKLAESVQIDSGDGWSNAFPRRVVGDVVNCYYDAVSQMPIFRA